MDMRHSFARVRVLTYDELELVKKNPGLANDIGHDLGPSEKTLETSGQATLALATTQPKKTKEITQPLSTRSENVRLISAVGALGWWISADEVSKSYLGNAFEKAESLLDRVYDDIGYEKFMATLKAEGYDDKSFSFFVNDTGNSFETDYSGEVEFADSHHEVGLGTWPGVETGPVIDAQGGVSGFYSAYNSLKKRFQMEGKTLDKRSNDEVLYIQVVLASKREDVKFYVYEGRTPTFSHGKLRVKSGDVLNQYDFMSLENPEDEFKGKRISEFLDTYQKRLSPMALAINKVLDHFNVPLKLGTHFNRGAQKETPPVFATQANLIPEQNGKHKPNLQNYQNSMYSQNTSGDFEEFCNRADAVVLTPHSEEILNNWDDHYLDLFDMWSSLIVNKQVCVEQFYGKPFIVLNEKNNFSFKEIFNGELNWDDPKVEAAMVDYIVNIDPAKDPWLKFIMLTRYLHEKGFVKQEPKELFRQLEPSKKGLEDEIMRLANKDRDERIKTFDYQKETFGKDRIDLFEISILGSAGTRVAKYTEDAGKIAYWAMSKGMHVRTGGGKYGIMGAAANGALRYLKEYPEHAHYCHLSSIQMPRTLQFEGASLTPKTLRDQNNKLLSVERNFDDRMTSIFRSDISIAIAPGIGTYQEIIRWLRNKRDGAPHLQGQKLILVNSEQPGNRHGIRLMDLFIRLLPEHVLKNDIIVVNTVEEAMDIAAKEQMRFNAQKPGFSGAVPHP